MALILGLEQHLVGRPALHFQKGAVMGFSAGGAGGTGSVGAFPAGS